MSDPSVLVRMAGCDWPGVAEAGRLVPATVCTVRRVSNTVTREFLGSLRGPARCRRHALSGCSWKTASSLQSSGTGCQRDTEISVGGCRGRNFGRICLHCE